MTVFEKKLAQAIDGMIDDMAKICPELKDSLKRVQSVLREFSEGETDA